MVRWGGLRQSGNVEDRRGRGPVIGGGLGCGGLILVIVISAVFGVDPRLLLEGAQVDPGPGGPPPEGDRAAAFVSAILGSTEDVLTAVLAEEGVRYAPPTLVLFDGAVSSACGMQSSAVGPFYCPLDEKVYLDLSFFRELARMGGPGDFAAAYVVAHEVGHHVQHRLGLTERLGTAEGAEGGSVRTELQADCLAGVWGHHANRTQRILEPGDVEEGLGAAAAIGDDVLQRRSQGVVVPESWTHGSSEERVAWLRRGLQTGSLAACDTSGALTP